MVQGALWSFGSLMEVGASSLSEARSGRQVPSLYRARSYDTALSRSIGSLGDSGALCRSGSLGGTGALIVYGSLGGGGPLAECG